MTVRLAGSVTAIQAQIITPQPHASQLVLGERAVMGFRQA